MIRKLKISDAESIKNLNKVLDEDSPLDLVKKQIEKLNNNSHYYIIGYEDETSNKIVGYIYAEIYESLYRDSGFNILNFAVLEEYQNKGIGKKLLMEIEREAEKRNYNFIKLNSGIDRVSAHKFYDHMGFNMEKLTKRFVKMM